MKWRIEVRQRLFILSVSGGNFIELVFHVASEIVIDVVNKVFLQK